MRTYSIYDDYGNLRFVLSPEAAKSYQEGTVIDQNSAVWKKGVTAYMYDSYNRLIEK